MVYEGVTKLEGSKNEPGEKKGGKKYFLYVGNAYPHKNLEGLVDAWYNFEKKYGAQFMKLPALLKQADYVTLHVPLLPSTHHLISTKEFNVMKKTAYLINTSRGPIVDEKALVAVLKNGDIRGAALDVYAADPAAQAAKLEEAVRLGARGMKIHKILGLYQTSVDKPSASQPPAQTPTL